MLFRVLSVATVILLCFCLFGKPNNHRITPHTRLCYDAGGGTNIWFYSYMRCRMKPDEDFTFNRYRVVKQTEKMYYENGGTLEVFCDRMVYLGVTNYFVNSDGYLLTPTTNFPNRCIWDCD